MGEESQEREEKEKRQKPQEHVQSKRVQIIEPTDHGRPSSDRLTWSARQSPLKEGSPLIDAFASFSPRMVWHEQHSDAMSALPFSAGLLLK